MLCNSISQRKSRKTHKRKIQHQPESLLRAEQLEGRHLLAVITVDSLLDNFDPTAPAIDGVVTLREAILAANMDTVVGDAPAGNGADEILFAVGVQGTMNTSRVVDSASSDRSAFLITDDLAISGPGADLLTIDASDLDPTPDSNLDDGTASNDGDGSSHLLCFRRYGFDQRYDTDGR